MSTSATSSNGAPPIIVAHGLKHTYRKSKKVRIEALDAIDLTVRQGEIFGLVGPDGAGKSTLLKALSGLIHPNEGTVTLAGEAPANVRELIGYVSQSGGVDPDLTVTENLSYVAGLHSLPSGEAEARTAELLRRLQLEPVADRLVASIGGGRRRMLTLAGALLPDPDFIFLDEPTNAIDPMSRRACWELLSERARAGKTIVLSTQFAWEADQCTRLAFMSGGTIQRVGTPAEMRDRMTEIKPGAGTASQLRDAFDSVIAGLEKHRPPPFPFARPVQHKSGEVGIRATGLTKSFGKVEAVQGINFEVPYGEIFGLVGESGTGKTSILRMLAGLLTTDDGDCEIAGEDSNRGLDYEDRRHIGYLAQSFTLFGELTVDDNLNFLAGIHQVPPAEFELKRDWVYELLSLQRGGKTLVDSLEAGDKRRLAFAAAVLHEPEVLLLDGPTTTVDPPMRHVLWDVLEGFAARGAAVLLATPYLTEAERCDRVGFLSDGRLLAVGTPAELKSMHDANVVEFDAGPSAIAVLRGMLKPWRVWPVAGRIHAIADGDAQTGVRELSKQLFESGIVMERVQTRPLSLEDVSVLLTADSRGRTMVREDQEVQMRRTIAQIRKELDSMRHDVVVVLLFLFLPFVQIYAWTVSPSLIPYGLTVAVQDLDRTPLSQLYTEGIRAALSYDVIPLAPGVRYEPLLDRSEARGAVVIPENFQRDFYAGKPVEVQWVIDGTQLKNAGKVKSGAAGVTNYVMSQLRPPGGSPPIQPKVRFWFNPGKKGYNYYAPGSFVIGIALFTPLMAALSFSRERARGATVRAFTSDISAHEFVIGKIAAYSLVGLVQAALCFAFIIWMFELEPVGDLSPFLCGTVIYTICNVTVGALIGVQVEGEVSAIGMAKTYGGVLTYVFSGHLFPLTHTPYPFGWLPGILPATHFHFIVRDYFQRAVGWHGVWDSTAILIVMTLVAFFFVWRKIRSLMGGT